MVIIGQATWPTESTADMGKLFKTLDTLPDFITGRDYAKSIESHGIKVISIFHFEDRRCDEVLQLIKKRYSGFFGVPGYTFTVDLWFEVAEAMDLIGLE